MLCNIKQVETDKDLRREYLLQRGQKRVSIQNMVAFITTVYS